MILIILPPMDGSLRVNINDKKSIVYNYIHNIYACLEIQKIMYGFGDSKHALKETAELIETVLKEQLIQLLNALFEVAAKTNSKTISMKEFLFLLR
jgi:hypothetical protein